MSMTGSDQAVLNQAIAQTQSGRSAEAYEILSRLQAAYPSNPEVLLWLAFSSENARQAYDWLTRLQSLDPSNPQLANAWHWYTGRFTAASNSEASRSQSSERSYSGLTESTNFANLPPDLQQLLMRVLEPGERALYIYPRVAESRSGWIVLTDRRYYRLFQGKFFNGGSSWLHVFEQLHPQAFHFGYTNNGKVTLKLAGRGKVKYSSDGSLEPDTKEKWQETVSFFDSLQDALEFCQLFYKVYGGMPPETSVLPDVPPSIASKMAQLSPQKQAILQGLLTPNERVLLIHDSFSRVGGIAILIIAGLVFGSFLLGMADLLRTTPLGPLPAIVMGIVFLLAILFIGSKVFSRKNVDQLVLTNGRIIQLGNTLVKAFPLDRTYIKLKQGSDGRGTLKLDGDIVDDCFYQEYGPITGIQQFSKIDLRPVAEIINRYGVDYSVPIARKL